MIDPRHTHNSPANSHPHTHTHLTRIADQLLHYGHMLRDIHTLAVVPHRVLVTAEEDVGAHGIVALLTGDGIVRHSGGKKASGVGCRRMQSSQNLEKYFHTHNMCIEYVLEIACMQNYCTALCLRGA